LDHVELFAKGMVGQKWGIHRLRAVRAQPAITDLVPDSKELPLHPSRVDVQSDFVSVSYVGKVLGGFGHDSEGHLRSVGIS
jgi:hypothetical protein